jgi:hypothetical protein
MKNEFDPKNYLHFVWGENNISSPEQQTYIIKLDAPPVSIRFDYSQGMFATFEEFYDSIADVQFFSNERPSKEKVDKILIDAWNFMALEERKLDEDLDEMEEDEDDF